MAKVPFTRRVSDFFTQGHWDVGIFVDAWTIAIGLPTIYIDGAPGWHFDSVGIAWDIGPWKLYAYWIDNN